MNKFIKITGSVIIASQLTACASIVSGSHQSISVKTAPVQGAQCNLKNDKGSWNIPKTPGRVVVHKSGEHLTVTCDKKGYKKARSEIKPVRNKASYGNVLLGGVVGASIDNKNGSAFQYAESIDMVLMPNK